jgi:hypothetical protein
MSSVDAWAALFDESPLKREARRFCASIQAHALIELGFEEHVNDYDAKNIALLSCQLEGGMKTILRDEAVERASGYERELIKEALDYGE